MSARNHPEPASPEPAASLSDSQVERLSAIVREQGSDPANLVEILHGVMRAWGHIPAGTSAYLATQLNLSRADVHGVQTFYRDFRTEPAGAVQIRLCRAEACQAQGCEELTAAVTQRFGVVLNGPPEQGISVESVYCLGLCSVAPAASVGEQPIGRATAERVAGGAQRAAGRPGPDDRRSPGSSMDPRMYVPADSAAVALGADEVAAALAEALAGSGSGAAQATLIRNGSRGLHWLEPLLEVADQVGVRYGFGPVSAADIPELLAAGVIQNPAGVQHRSALGPVERLDWLARQNRWVFQRVGVIDPVDPLEYRNYGGLDGLRNALAMTPEAVVEAVIASGLRGRGGAGFSTGLKWRTVAQAPGPRKAICCNADEGDSGTFADRMLIEGDPFSLIEAMVIAGYAVGANEGYIYLRSEYPAAIARLRQAIAMAQECDWLGDDILGSGFSFNLVLRVGAGAYICGEETSMLNSLEGKRGVVRAKPPIPALEGLFGRPTVVNNVLTLGAVPGILRKGAAVHASYGVGRSRGTQVFQLAGNIARGGIVETGFGITVNELVNGYGGGTASGRPIGAVQVGGPLGAYLMPEDLDAPAGYEELGSAPGLEGTSAAVGHGGMVVFDDTVDLMAQARYAFEFCAHESCGLCTPCRVGSVRGTEVIDRLREHQDPADAELLSDLCDLMVAGSMCAMGSMTPIPVRSALRGLGTKLQEPR